MAIREMLPTIPPVLLAQWAITNPTTALAECRIYGSNDATYGTVGWVPRRDGQPFCVIYGADTTDDEQKEPNRIWATYTIKLFLAVAHADTPSVAENFNDVALAWLDAARQVIASNRRVGTAGASYYPTAGDSRWVMRGGNIVRRFPIMGVPYYGVEVHTEMRLVVLVQYQQ